MLLEITCASDFLCRYVAPAASCTPQILEAFKKQIVALMQEKYTNHWDPQRPYYGNGYRAITSFGGQVDPLLCEAAQKSLMPIETLEGHIPKDLVLWVEPFTVSFRVGDHGTINTIYDGVRGKVLMTPPSPPHLGRPARISHAVPITSPLTKSQVIIAPSAPAPPTSSKIAIMAH
ncbi:transducer of ERBB2 [Lunasporangiospora selenospora]|uniref:Transducer of ERBB2 n=1 Tax=Lunasporangiospora selenospora TaxID=979761 RepID=A0A9P6KAQ6_9FUNG|nr:transducer of ERBB2 [Lunasporangiospora selenospora]